MDHQAFAQLLGNYGEFFGAIAVVVTLVYLVIQLRHNTQATRASTAQALADSINELNLMLAKDPELARLYQTGKFGDWDSLTPDEQFRWGYFATAGCRSFEAVFTNARLNQVDQQTIELVKETLRSHFTTSAWKNWWRQGHETLPFTRDFVEFVENECM